MELFEYTASQLSGMLREKKVSAAEVTQSVLDRIEAVDEKVKVYLTVTGDLFSRFHKHNIPLFECGRGYICELIFSVSRENFMCLYIFF